MMDASKIDQHAVKAADAIGVTPNSDMRPFVEQAVKYALTAALSDKQAGEVKALNWIYREQPVRTYCASDDRGDLYWINQSFGSDSYYFTTVRMSDGSTLYDSDDLDAAKAAAQADYEQRIRSALADVPALEPVAYLRLESRTDIDGETYTGLQMSDVSDERSFPVYTSLPLTREGEDSAEASFMTLVSRYGDAPTQEGFDQIYRRYLSDCALAATRSGSAPAHSGGDHG